MTADLPTHPSTEAAPVHKPFTDDGVTYCGWDGRDGCGQLWPCDTVRANQPITAPSTEAVGEVRRQEEEWTTNVELENAVAEVKRARGVETMQAYEVARLLPDDLRAAFWEDAVKYYLADALALAEAAQRDGWTTPGEANQLRSDLSAMTSDRDWLKEELGKAAAEIAELRESEPFSFDDCRPDCDCGGHQGPRSCGCHVTGAEARRWIRELEAERDEVVRVLGEVEDRAFPDRILSDEADRWLVVLRQSVLRLRDALGPKED